jgi:hypothetical protein
MKAKHRSPCVQSLRLARLCAGLLMLAGDSAQNHRSPRRPRRLGGEIRLYFSGKFASRNFIAFSPIIFRMSSSEYPASTIAPVI